MTRKDLDNFHVLMFIFIFTIEDKSVNVFVRQEYLLIYQHTHCVQYLILYN